MTAGKIAANAITAGTIAANAITTSKLIADAALKINANKASSPTFYMNTSNHTLVSVSVTSVTGKFVVMAGIDWDGSWGFDNLSHQGGHWLTAEVVLDGSTVLDTFYVKPDMAGNGSISGYFFLYGGTDNTATTATISAGSHALSLRVRSQFSISPATARNAVEATIVAFEQRDNG